MIMKNQEEKKLAFDIKRSIMLCAYMDCWQMPDERVISRRGEDRIEIYSFRPHSEITIHRFATIGLSSICREDGAQANYELFMALPGDLRGATPQQVESFMMDVAAYSLRSNVKFCVSETIPETPLMPPSWAPRAILLEEPRGEPEELESFSVGSQQINLIWLVPIYKEELDFIREHGIEQFDELESKSEWSLVDPTRPSVTEQHED
jgi:hypothetical protein